MAYTTRKTTHDLDSWSKGVAPRRARSLPSSAYVLGERVRVRVRIRVRVRVRAVRVRVRVRVRDIGLRSYRIIGLGLGRARVRDKIIPRRTAKAIHDERRERRR